MGYRDYFMPRVKWAKVPFKDLPDGIDGEEGAEGDSDTASTLLGEKPKPQSKFRLGAGRAIWLLHIVLLCANVAWLITWNNRAHPADLFSRSPGPRAGQLRRLALNKNLTSRI